MCDPTDIGTTIDSSILEMPTLFVYDRYPGGIGFPKKVYQTMEEVIIACLMVVSECSCKVGCPPCVGAPLPPTGEDSGTRGTIPDKDAAQVDLQLLLERELVVSKPSWLSIEGGKKANALEIPLGPDVLPPILVNVLPKNVEEKIRKKVRGFRK